MNYFKRGKENLTNMVIDVGTILMNLSNDYDCIPHDLVITKSEAYGLHRISLTILFDYLNNRKQRIRTGYSFSTWYDIIKGIPE